MKLSRRQTSVINDMIMEEVKSVFAGRRTKTLNERLDAHSVDDTVMKQVIDEHMEGPAQDAAIAVVNRFAQTVISVATKALNDHAMSGDHAIPNTPRMIENDLEDFYGDDMMLASQECVTEVSEALMKYATTLGAMIAHMAGGDSPE